MAYVQENDRKASDRLHRGKLAKVHDVILRDDASGHGGRTVREANADSNEVGGYPIACCSVCAFVDSGTRHTSSVHMLTKCRILSCHPRHAWKTYTQH